MPKKKSGPAVKASAVTRHLHYAWIEFGHTADGRAFGRGLERMGWKNLLEYLPRTRDRGGPRLVERKYPHLPIRWRGSTRMILPNIIKDKWDPDRLVRWYVTRDASLVPWIKDPLLIDYRKAHGWQGLLRMTQEYLNFLTEWTFHPGLKRTSDTEAELTIKGDATHQAELVAISGHGAGGSVSGGWNGCELSAYLDYGAATELGKLKYLLIPACMGADWGTASSWLPVLRRARPVHGVFGYAGSYPGDGAGRRIYQRFAEELRAKHGSQPILECYRAAHKGPYRGNWGAVIHTSAVQDTMRDWLAGKLATPNPDGEVRFYCEDFWPNGTVVTEITPLWSVRMHMADGTEINKSNKHRPDVGLFAGEKGFLRFSPDKGSFMPHWMNVCVFYYYRPEKDGMDLDRLLKFDFSAGPQQGWTASTKTNKNEMDKTTHTDAVEIYIKKEISEVKIPFEVRPDAPMHYSDLGGNRHGYFWTETEEPEYHHGAWLRRR